MTFISPFEASNSSEQYCTAASSLCLIPFFDDPSSSTTSDESCPPFGLLESRGHPVIFPSLGSLHPKPQPSVLSLRSPSSATPTKYRANPLTPKGIGNGLNRGRGGHHDQSRGKESLGHEVSRNGDHGGPPRVEGALGHHGPSLLSPRGHAPVLEL
ncbi:hypothetical protein CRG98_005143 [Punica granatum]|uniref:Uncharacterized protein n=1 Tax=Punica granatum TaxID=22663 RepID=A0A2I0L175_PUNGR|nr:hypothetical protein CRG98_005143 [Punica granatum]